MPTLSPSMDICVSSNFERFLFHLSGDNGEVLAEWLSGFEATGARGACVTPGCGVRLGKAPCRCRVSHQERVKVWCSVRYGMGWCQVRCVVPGKVVFGVV